MIFVGSFVEGKAPAMIFEALKEINIKEKRHIELWMVGGGELEEKLKFISDSFPPSIKTVWYGYRDIKEVRKLLSQADCLILPSRHDGWGAVASEAIIEGTSVICSDQCGVAGVVKKSGGMVFKSNSLDDLLQAMQVTYDKGKVDASKRNTLKRWGYALTTPVGAVYLHNILFGNVVTHIPPWETDHNL